MSRSMRVCCQQDTKVCALRVANETRAWQAGKCLLFDDAFEHEVWYHKRESSISEAGNSSDAASSSADGKQQSTDNAQIGRAHV